MPAPSLYEFRESQYRVTAFDILDLEDTYAADYEVEHRTLSDAEIADFRAMFADYCERTIYGE